jgi:GDP-mannose transporter
MGAMGQLDVAGYMCFSATLLLLNKLAIHHTQAPSVVLLLQLACSAVAVRVAGAGGYVVVDALEWPKVRAFAPMTLTFLTLLVANAKTLQYANVETFIVFRSSTPVLISLADWALLGRELPSARSWACLGALVGGAAAYVATDSNFNLSGYQWLVVWYAVFLFDQVYVKHVIQSVRMESTWGRVFYTNLLSVPPLLCTSGLGDELSLMRASATPEGMAALGASCVAGVGMSYFSFAARKRLSAAHFTVVGNICKIGTVALNVLVWDKHATQEGIAALLVCLAAGYAYEPAPLRPAAAAEAEAEVAGRPGCERRRKSTEGKSHLR